MTNSLLIYEESGSFNDEMIEFIDRIFGHKDMISKNDAILSKEDLFEYAEEMS
jgi:hypothetical protein